MSSTRTWREFPFSAKIKTIGYVISVVSVVLLALVSWRNASKEPLLAVCLIGGAVTSVVGMGLRWWSYEIEQCEQE